jgi:hypothetical protein
MRSVLLLLCNRVSNGIYSAGQQQNTTPHLIAKLLNWKSSSITIYTYYA